MTPILGGYLADKLLGNRMAVMLGALLMAIGHLVLGASETAPLFLACRWRSSSAATGCLNPNVSCLLGEAVNPPIRVAMAAFSLMYAAGNIRLDYRAVACGAHYREEYSWAMGFAYSDPSAWSWGW